MGLKIHFQDDDISLDFDEDSSEDVFVLTVGKTIFAEDGVTIVSEKVASTRINQLRMERIGHAFNSVLKRISDIQEKRNVIRGGSDAPPSPSSFRAPDAKRRN